MHSGFLRSTEELQKAKEAAASVILAYVKSMLQDATKLDATAPMGNPPELEALYGPAKVMFDVSSDSTREDIWRFVYEMGSARGSVARNGATFRVQVAPPVLKHLARLIEAQQGLEAQHGYNSAVIIVYLGASFTKAMHIARGKDSSKEKESAKLSFHTDNIPGASENLNCQESVSLISTFSLMAPRALSIRAVDYERSGKVRRSKC